MLLIVTSCVYLCYSIYIPDLATTMVTIASSTVHFWINNAGINGGRWPFSELSHGTIEAVVRVNLLGSLLCTHEAMKLMQAQPNTVGHIFNTVGSGVKP